MNYNIITGPVVDESCSETKVPAITFKQTCLFILQLEMEDGDSIDVFQQQTGGSL